MEGRKLNPAFSGKRKPNRPMVLFKCSELLRASGLGFSPFSNMSRRVGKGKREKKILKIL